MIISCVKNRIEAIKIARICKKSVYCMFIDKNGKTYSGIIEVSEEARSGKISAP